MTTEGVNMVHVGSASRGQGARSGRYHQWIRESQLRPTLCRQVGLLVQPWLSSSKRGSSSLNQGPA